MKAIAIALLILSTSDAYSAVSVKSSRFGAPQINDKQNLTNPALGDIVLDSSDDMFWGYNGDTGNGENGWVSFSASSAQTNQSSDISNLSIATSVGSNALTISIKDKNGDDPSSGSPVSLSFRSSTANSGIYSTSNLTGALSLTISSGSTLGCQDGVECILYVHAVETGSGIAIGVSGKPFDEGTLVSTTAEGGSGGADSSNVLYSSTALSSRPVRRIGRIKITQTTAGTWATNSSELATLLQPPSAYSAGSERIERATVSCASSGSTATSKSSPWLTVGNRASGACTLTFATGVFSATPTCVANFNTVGANNTIVNSGTTSATAGGLACVASGSACASDFSAQLICMGPR